MKMLKILPGLAAAVFLAFAATGVQAGNYEKGNKTEKADIVDTAVAAGDFDTLVAALKAAGLVEALKGEGPFTVFAPTNAAFEKLGEEKINELLMPENKDTLTAILTYHVVSGKVKSKDLAGKTTEAETLQGGKVSIDGTDGVKVNDAKVVKADIYTSNGVIHVIDTVLVP